MRQLVEHESQSLLAVETIRGAADSLTCSPETLVNKIVQHFQKLFSCPQIEGIIPCMSKAYMEVNENRNFMKSLSGILGLDAGSGSAACLSKIRELLGAKDNSLDLQEDYMCVVRQGAPSTISLVSVKLLLIHTDWYIPPLS